MCSGLITATSPVEDAFLVRNGREMQIIIGNIETFDMGSAIHRSTCGFIRSEALPGIRMTAMSGWSGSPRSNLALNPVKYTQLVREVAAQLGFVLPADRWDNGNRGPPTAEQIGRFRACHIVGHGTRRNVKTFADITIRRRSSLFGGSGRSSRRYLGQET
jgi:hypothetical protein